MSMIDFGPNFGKHCFTYCGDDFCDCELAPRYQGWPAQGTEAGTAETEGLGPKDDGPVLQRRMRP